MKSRDLAVTLVTSLILTGVVAGYSLQSACALGTASIAVTNVYWGTNQLAPSTARPGDVNAQLSIVLNNVGEDVARGVNATMLLSSPLRYTYYLDGREYEASSVSKMAGDITAGSSFTVSFTLSVDSSAKEGIYRYVLQLSYMSPRELQQFDSRTTIDVPIWRGDLHVQKVSTNPTKVYPDSKQVRIIVVLVNSGKGIASDIRIKMDLKPPFKASSSGSNMFYLGNLPEGQVTEMEFMVDITKNASFGQYSLILAEERGEALSLIGQVPIYIEEKVKFEIVSVTPSSVSSDAKGVVLRVLLRNSGSLKAESVRIQLLVGNYFTGTLTDFLGTILAGETKVASFTIDIDSKAQVGPRNLDLRIDWVQDNTALDETLRLPINVQSPTIASATTVLSVIAVIALVGYFVMKRRGMTIPQIWKRMRK